MDPISVIITEIPEQSWVKDWVPLFVALIAVAISVYSTYLTRKQHIRASRPFVWAMNFGSKGEHDEITIRPETIKYMISNAPGLLITSTIEIYGIDHANKKNVLYKHVSKNTIMFPSDLSSYYHTIPKSDSILKSTNRYKELLRRICIKYHSLAGGDNYFYEVICEFDSSSNTWIKKHEKGN